MLIYIASSRPGRATSRDHISKEHQWCLYQCGERVVGDSGKQETERKVRRLLRRGRPQTPKGLARKRSRGATAQPCPPARPAPEVDPRSEGDRTHPLWDMISWRGQCVRKASFRSHFLSLWATFPSLPSLPESHPQLPLALSPFLDKQYLSGPALAREPVGLKPLHIFEPPWDNSNSLVTVASLWTAC